MDWVEADLRIGVFKPGAKFVPGRRTNPRLLPGGALFLFCPQSERVEQIDLTL
jgi:hypothetical protein